MKIIDQNPTFSSSHRRASRFDLVLILIAFISAFFVLSATAQNGPRDGSPNDFRKSNRQGPDESGPNMKKPGDVKMGMRTIEFPTEFRTISGFGNNLNHPEWGAADIPFLRRTTVDYADGVDAPSGSDRPSARAVSNAVCAQEESIYNRRMASDYLWQWGQFLDHDITLTPTNDFIEPFNIEVPAGDPFFDPTGSGTAEISLDRSFSETVNGVREQVNEITAFIDASNVYGSDEERAEALRMLDGTGRLKVSDGNLLPFNVDGLPNAPSAEAPNFFLAGDFRANEQAGLTALHTLFVREHNYWAAVINRSNDELEGDEIYEVARSIVGAEMQVITYQEFLPLLLGEGAIPRYRGYRENTNPGITNVFATASYRFGHTMLSSQLLRLDRRMREVDEGHLDLASAFFNPALITDEGGIEPLLRGLSRQPAQEIDTLLVDDVRNFLFGPPGSGGFDLASLNIQRGRDHGLPGLNEVRRNFGLKPIDDFHDLTKDDDLEDGFESVYDSVEEIDVWVGGLAERPVRGAMVGETIHAILRDQFLRLRDGDRFWYQNHLDKELQRLVEQQTLAKIIRRNTEILKEVEDNPFLVGRHAPTLNSSGKGDRPGGRGPGMRPPMGRPR
ncbi:MAG: peroxidase family protein [Verrucomicrobiales bacterium]|nr:peroxidase family protein [Verrucomicrobiales bacterium]